MKSDWVMGGRVLERVVEVGIVRRVPMTVVELGLNVSCGVVERAVDEEGGE